MIKISITLISLYFAQTTSSFAYLDPGTGSIILQAIIAVIALIGSYMSFYWKKVKDFFKKFTKKKSDKN
tara:strand:- start:333 stop:539 length:207 start_codon:yes stop_codon:yes gene_type:complete